MSPTQKIFQTFSLRGDIMKLYKVKIKNSWLWANSSGSSSLDIKIQPGEILLKIPDHGMAAPLGKELVLYSFKHNKFGYVSSQSVEKIK